MPTKSVTFEDFSGGYAGKLPTWRLPQSMWHGLNLVASVDGSLIPRSGLVRYELTGVGNGQITGMGWADGGEAPDKAWYVQGTNLFAFDPYDVTTAVSSATGVLSAVPIRVLHWWDEAGVVWITNYADRIYKYDLTANTLTAVPNTTGGPAGRCIVSWGSFLVTGGPPTNPAYIYWSDGEGLDDWVPAGFSEPIGSLNSAVTGLFVLRGQLVVAKDDGSWWVITGDLPTSEFPESIYNVRNVFSGQTPLQEPQHGAVIGGQAVWLVARSAPWPSWFNGSTLQDLNYLRADLVPTPNGGIQPNCNVHRLTGPADLLVSAGSVGSDRLMLKDSIWSRHVFSIPSLEWTAPMADGLVLLSDGGEAIEAPKFYVWHADAENPPDESAQLESVTDDGTEYDVEVELPEWVSDDGAEVLARSVTVDFRRVDQGAGAPPQGFAIQVASTRRSRDESEQMWSAVQRWSGPSRTVSKDRAAFMLGDQGNGAGWVVRLFDVRGVAIQRVRVQVIEESERVM
jgi:hypothetical protein